MAFTDGACSGNPGPGGFGYIIIFPDDQVIEGGGSANPTTNNRMEMQGAIAVLRGLSGVRGKVKIHTDSSYVIKGITLWLGNWKANGWQTAAGQPVSNMDLWKDLSACVEERGASTIEWLYVAGHQGIAGNERADEIAVAYSLGQPIGLFKGKLAGYGIDILNVTSSDIPRAKSPKSSGKKPLSYLSMLGGVVFRHGTWTDCERRVKGQSGAKYKKAHSAQEEQEILASWGKKPGDVKS